MGCADEYEAAAEWCARRGLLGKEGDPLPLNMGAEAVESIAADVPAFQERVRAHAYALAMTRHNLPEE